MKFSKYTQEEWQRLLREEKVFIYVDHSTQKDTLSIYEYEEYIKMKERLYKQLSRKNSVSRTTYYLNMITFISSMILLLVLLVFFLATNFFWKESVELTAQLLGWK